MDIGLIALDMVELDVELLAQQYEEQSQIAKMAEAQKRIIKKQLGQIMDLQGQDNLSTCEWKILRQEESGGTRLMKKDDLQEKFGKKKQRVFSLSRLLLVSLIIIFILTTSLFFLNAESQVLVISSDTLSPGFLKIGVYLYG